MKKQDSIYMASAWRTLSRPLERTPRWVAFLLIAINASLSVAIVLVREESVVVFLAVVLVLAFLLAMVLMVSLAKHSFNQVPAIEEDCKPDMVHENDIDEIRALEERLSSEVADLRRCLLQGGTLSANAGPILGILAELVREMSENRPIGEVNNNTDLSISLKTAIGAISGARSRIVALPQNSLSRETGGIKVSPVEKIAQEEIEKSLTDTPIQGIDTINHRGKSGCLR